jgi:phage N-6-adenine-methyltransferase
MTVHVTQNTGHYEWYTPQIYIDAVRQVLGEIDLDPASSTAANQIVQASCFYSEADNGLAQPWRGRIFMNPPYANDLISRFTAKLAAHFHAGDITAAIVLVNNATETSWFGNLVSVASAIVFPKTRIRYLRPDGTPKATGLQGQAFVYCGQQPYHFLRVFTTFGWGTLVYSQQGEP